MNDETRLESRPESWKEIGAYLERLDDRPPMGEGEGLHSHKARSSVYGYPSEIDAKQLL